MQIATLSYRYKPKEKGNGENRAKLFHRQILTTITNPTKKIKQRRSLHSDLTGQTNGQLPPINQAVPRRTSIRIQGSSLPSSKLGDASACSFQHQSRSHSRQSNKSDHRDGRSRSNTPMGMMRPSSKLVRLRFGYPVKLRTPDFYAPDRSEKELHSRENSFVNDSIRAAHQYHHESIIPHYEALDDPHLRRFFQSPVVLDVVRKTLNADPNHSYKQDDRSSKMSMNKNRARSNDLYEHRREDYRRIVTKGSSGYARLNGYDCIPGYASTRHINSTDGRTSTSLYRNHSDLHFNHSASIEKNRTSTLTSITSFPATNTKEYQKPKKNRSKDKSKVIRASSPRGDLAQRSFEIRTTNVEPISTTQNNHHSREQIQSALTTSVTED